jgi:hypothetical protein
LAYGCGSQIGYGESLQNLADQNRLYVIFYRFFSQFEGLKRAMSFFSAPGLRGVGASFTDITLYGVILRLN